MMRARPWALWLGVVFLGGTPLVAAGVTTPLADAVEQQDWDTIDSLLDGSVDVNEAQVDGMTALHWASYYDEVDLVGRLVTAGADVQVVNRYGVTPLSLAAENGNQTIVERLLDTGADANTALPGGETVLMTAARSGRVGVVRALIAHGADILAKEERRGQTPLMWAVAEGHADIVETLIEVGADFTAPLDSGFTPFLFAVREGHLDVVRVLVSAGVDVNGLVTEVVRQERTYRAGRPIRVGTSPLLVAVTNAHWDVAAALLDAGADPNVNASGYTALHMIPKVRKPGVGDNNPAPEGSGRMTSLEFVRKLAESGADVNGRMTQRRNLNNTRHHEQGSTPFMLAALVADVPLMQTLVDLGADPVLTNAEGSTPLMAAAGLGTRSPGEDAGTEGEVLEAVQLALDLGNDINAVDDKGETAMHGAAYKNLPGVVALLTASGADIDVWARKNDFGWSPLTIARGFRFGNFKPSPVTVVAVEQAMLAAGITPPTEAEEAAEGYDIYTPRQSTTVPTVTAPAQASPR